MDKKIKLLISILIILETSVVFTGCGSSLQSLNKTVAASSTSANVSAKSDNLEASNNDNTTNNISNNKSNTAENSFQNTTNTSTPTGKSTKKVPTPVTKPTSTPIDKPPVNNIPPYTHTNESSTTPASTIIDTSGSKSNTSTNKSTTTQDAVQAPVNITEKDVKSFSQTLNCDIKIPVIGGLKNKTIQTNINTLFEYDILSFKSTIEEQAHTGLEESKKENYPFRQYVVNTTYKVHYNQNGILSITVTYYQFTDGAHGMTTEKAYNYDLSTGKMLKLSDLFPKSSNYTQVISTEILNAMKADPSKYFDDSITSYKNIDVNNKYYLENGSLVIYYDLYEIAPYVSGIPEFKIPFSKLTFTDTLNIK